MLADWLLLAVGALSALLALNARWPQRSRHLIFPSWFAAMFAVEAIVHLVVLGLVLVGVLIASGALGSAVGIAGLVLWTGALLLAVPWGTATLRTKLDVEGRPATLDLDARDAPRMPWWLLVFPFLFPWRPGVRHERGIVFAEVDGTTLKLDVTRPRNDPGKKLPAIIHIHGGAWFFGSRHEQGLPLLNHLAANGWIGFNVDYRLSPKATMPEHVQDVKRAIAWIREHADELGVDASFIAITGGSAGGHMAALCALTAGDPYFQPGFEEADTSLQAAVPLYGIYDILDPKNRAIPSLKKLLIKIVMKATPEEDMDRYLRLSPIHQLSASAPPFFVIHGEADTLIGAIESRDFVHALREASREVVVYAEMPGGQHAFDIFPTWRSAPVIRGVERFLHAAHASRGQTPEATEQAVESAVTA